MLSDESLACKSLDGDMSAFEELVNRYKRPVFSIVYRMIGQYQEAEDITQEVFIKAYRKLTLYDTSLKFSAWIGRITHNTCIDLIRKDKNYQVVNSDNLIVEDVEESVDEHIIRKEQKQWIEEQIRQLKPGYSTPLLLFHQGGLSYEEIAKSMNVPLSIVKNRIFRARKMLKEKMAGYYKEA